MRILLLNQFYPPDVAATGQLLADLAEGLSARGHEVHVVCSRRAYGGGTVRQPAERPAGGVRVHRVSASGFGRASLAGRLADYLSFYVMGAWRAIALGRMDACVCLTTPPFIGLVGVLLKLRSTRLVLWTMDLYPQIAVACGYLKPDGLATGLLAWLSRRIHRAAARVIALGEVMAQKLQQAGADAGKIATVHNWVPGEAIRPIQPSRSEARRKWNKDGRVTLMYSGNLGVGHELDTALHAVARLGTRVNLRVLFVGEGKMRSGLTELAKSLGLDCVSFHPPQPLSALSDSLAAGDIHLVSQRAGTEGLIVPSKLYGVMAAARPILFIGPDQCEVARIIGQSGSGIVVGCGDCDGAAEALAKLAADADLRQQMGTRGREYYLAHFGLRRSVAAIADIIEGT